MVAVRISLVLRRWRQCPLDMRRVLIDGKRSSWRSRRGHFVGARFLCSASSPSSDVGAGVEVDDLPSLREYIATLGVFFTLPEQGVTSPEILTRCSATPVRRTPSAPLRFVAAAHAVMPWAFPGYHDESHAWLNFIDKSRVRYYAELRDPLTGTILTQYEVVNLAKHPSRDVAALGLKGADNDDDEGEEGQGDDESRVLDDIRARGIPFSPLLLRRRLIGQSDALQIVGYEVQERPGGLGRGEDPGMMMIRAKGELRARTAVQAFVSTDHATLNPGMCGAAVLDSDMELCGCVEGVVPTPPPEAEVEAHVRALQGMPCVVEWKDLDTLLKASTLEDAGSADGADDERQARPEEPLSHQKDAR